MPRCVGDTVVVVGDRALAEAVDDSRSDVAKLKASSAQSSPFDLSRWTIDRAKADLERLCRGLPDILLNLPSVSKVSQSSIAKA